ncbi:MAG: SIS domain-containing protein [Legionellaceae bacterium]|nr:SIS domain-containing protein [Legionellaceae bacterium]
MSVMTERIQQLFSASIEAKITAADSLPELIIKAGTRLSECLLNNGKLFVCGNGGSAANALHFSTAMLNHFEAERPALPVITLTTDMALTTALLQEGQGDHVFSRALQALGTSGDVLLLLSTSTQTMNLVHAVDAAHDRGMDVVCLAGTEGGVLANHLGPDDIEVVVPGEGAARIREMHLFVLHCFCDLIDQALFGQMMG